MTLKEKNKILINALETNLKGLQWAIDNDQYGVRGFLIHLHRITKEALEKNNDIKE